MINYHSLRPTFSLSTLTWIINYKWIKMRYWPENRFGKAFIGKCYRLSWKPLEVSMFTEMDYCMRPEVLSEPKIKSEISMWRW